MSRQAKAAEKYKKQSRAIQRTTSETLRLATTTASTATIRKAEELIAAGVSQQSPQKTTTSSFQITGVSVKSDVDDDSCDELDESKTEDLSRLDNETPSFSESTYSPSRSPEPPSPRTIAVPQEEGRVPPSPRILGDRFQVVKIESYVPFYRGRWKCIDYLDNSPHAPKDGYVFVNNQYVRNPAGLKPPATTSIPAVTTTATAGAYYSKGAGDQLRTVPAPQMAYNRENSVPRETPLYIDVTSSQPAPLPTNLVSSPLSYPICSVTVSHPLQNPAPLTTQAYAPQCQEGYGSVTTQQFNTAVTPRASNTQFAAQQRAHPRRGSHTVPVQQGDNALQQSAQQPVSQGQMQQNVQQPFVQKQMQQNVQQPFVQTRQVQQNVQQPVSQGQMQQNVQQPLVQKQMQQNVQQPFVQTRQVQQNVQQPVSQGQMQQNVQQPFIQTQVQQNVQQPVSQGQMQQNVQPAFVQKQIQQNLQQPSVQKQMQENVQHLLNQGRIQQNIQQPFVQTQMQQNQLQSFGQGQVQQNMQQQLGQKQIQQNTQQFSNVNAQIQNQWNTPIQAQQMAQTQPQQMAPIQTQQMAPIQAQQMTPIKTQHAQTQPQQMSPVKTQQMAPIQTQQMAPIQTQQMAPIQTQQMTPIKTQHAQTQPQQMSPVKTQQMAPIQTQQMPPIQTQQMAPIQTQQMTPIKTQHAQTQPQQMSPVKTQQMAPIQTQQIAQTQPQQITPIKTQKTAQTPAQQTTPQTSVHAVLTTTQGPANQIPIKTASSAEKDEAKKDPPPVPQMAPNTMQPLQITVNYNAPFYMSQGGFPVMQQHDNLLMKIPGLAAASTNTTNEANIAVQANMAAEELQSVSGNNIDNIDNKIEQAMDLVKSHLMYTVREEVEVLKEKIAELLERINQLEVENNFLRANVAPEVLTALNNGAAKKATITAGTAAN